MDNLCFATLIRRWYNNQKACEDAGFKWYMVSHADNLVLGNNSFVCAHTQFARVNQLGNGREDSIISQSADPATVGKLANHDIQGVNANRFLWVSLIRRICIKNIICFYIYCNIDCS